MIAYLNDTVHNFVGTLKQKWESLDVSHSWYGPLLLYGGLGLITGFLFKYLARPILWIILGTVLILWLLNTFNLVSIHYDAITSFFGFPSTANFQEALNGYLAWAQAHMAESIAFVVGFFISWTFA